MAFGSGGMQVSLSTSTVSGFGTGTVSTGIVTATVVGGAAPLSYLWTFNDGDGDILPFAPTSNATAFYKDGVTDMDSLSADFVCVVTDANGATVQSGVVTANITGV